MRTPQIGYCRFTPFRLDKNCYLILGVSWKKTGCTPQRDSRTQKRAARRLRRVAFFRGRREQKGALLDLSRTYRTYSWKHGQDPRTSSSSNFHCFHRSSVIYSSFRNSSSPMFAIRGGSLTYHLVETKTGLTVCGLRTIAMRVKRKRGTGLSQTPTQPLDALLCKHCLRLSAPESFATDSYRISD
jgi:hypothetical protein